MNCFSIRTFLAKCLSIVLAASLVFPPNAVQAQSITFPPIGTLLNPTSKFNPINVKGLSVHQENPFQFEFIVDPGDVTNADQKHLRDESMKMIKYFLTTLTVPDNEMWVNLSPVEKDRIIADGLGQTVMGKHLLALDYMLKQLTASLMNPETESGKKFWEKVYASGIWHSESGENPNANEQMLNAVQSFNKVWIVPAKASIYQRGTSAIIVENHLKVMLESDYLAQTVGADLRVSSGEHTGSPLQDDIKSIIRTEIIPIIEKEVNEGETFANLRQIYNAMLLATWYKRNLKKSILSQVYINQNKINGVESGDPQAIENIYDQYVASFKAGAANLIKEEYDPETQQAVARQYFTGGMEDYGQLAIDPVQSVNLAQLVEGDFVASVNIAPGLKNQAMLFNLKEPFARQIEGYRIKIGDQTTQGRVQFELHNAPYGTTVSLDIGGNTQELEWTGSQIQDVQSEDRGSKITVFVSQDMFERMQQSNFPLSFKISEEVGYKATEVSFIVNQAMLFNPQDPYSSVIINQTIELDDDSQFFVMEQNGKSTISYGAAGVAAFATAALDGRHIKEVKTGEQIQIVVSPAYLREIHSQEAFRNFNAISQGKKIVFLEDSEWPSEDFFHASERLADFFQLIRAEEVDLNKVAENLNKNNVVFVEMLRDALQNLQNVNLSIEQRWRIIEAYLSAGVKNIEYSVHSKLMPDAPAMGAYLADKNIPADVNLMELVFNERGVEEALKNPKIKTIAFNVSASPKYGEDNYKESDLEKWINDRIAPLIAIIKEDPRNLNVRIYISHVWGYEKDPDYQAPDISLIIKMIDKLKALGITEIALSDTTGKAKAREVKEVFDRVLEHQGFEDLKIGFHGHDRDGNGLVNALASVEAGAHFIDASTANMGGSPHLEGTIPGNVPMEDTLFFVNNLDVQTGAQVDKYLEVVRFVLGLVGEDSRGSQMMGLHNLKDFEIRMLQRQFGNERAVSTGKLRGADHAMFATDEDQQELLRWIKSPLSIKQKWVWNAMDKVSRKKIGSEAGKIDEENNINSPRVENILKLLTQRLWFLGPRAVGASFSKKPDTMSEVIMTTLIARGSQGIALIYDVWNALTAFPLWYAGTAKQKIKYLIPLLKGQVFFCFGLTEIRAAGSDAIRGIKSTAKRQEGGRYLMDFGKHYITVGEKAQYIIVFADVNPDDVGAPEDKANRIGAFIVRIRDEKGNLLPGFEAKHMEVIGHHGSGTLEIFSKEGQVYAEEILGDNWLTIAEKGLDPKKVKTGANISMKTLEAGRISISSIALGSQLATIEELEKAYEKRSPNMTRIQQQEWLDTIADLRVDFTAGWNLIRQVAELKDRKQDYNLQAAALKMITTETDVRNNMRAMRLVGAIAALPGHPLERIFRDNKLLTIGEGTTQIMRNVIINEIYRKNTKLGREFSSEYVQFVLDGDLVHQGVRSGLETMSKKYNAEPDMIPDLDAGEGKEKPNPYKEIIQWQIVDLIAEGIVLKAGESNEDEYFDAYEDKVTDMPKRFRELELLRANIVSSEIESDPLVVDHLAGLLNGKLTTEKPIEVEIQDQIGELVEQVEEFLSSTEDISSLMDHFIGASRVFAQKLMDLSENYAKERTIQVIKKKGQPDIDVKMINKVQVSHMLIERGRRLVQKMSLTQKPEKLAATLMEIADIAVQVHGGYGYSTETEPAIIYRKAAVFAIMFLDRAREIKISQNNAMLTVIDKQKPAELVKDFVTYLMDQQLNWWTQEIKDLNDERIGYELKVPNRQSGASAVNLQIGNRYHVFEMISSSNETVYTIFDDQGKYVAQGVYEGALNKVVRALVNWAKEEGRKDEQAERKTKDGYIADLLKETGLNNAMLEVDQIAPGGIDLDGSKTQIDILGDDSGMEWKVDPAMLQQLRSVDFKGFNPVIIDIKPITATPLYSELTGQPVPKRADREGQQDMTLALVREE